MTEYKLIYLNGRGRAEVARLIFVQAGVPFEDVRISDQEWPKLKSTTPFGTLPVLEENGHIIPQSKALTRYLARQFGLTGNNELEAALCDGLVDGAEDVSNKMAPWFKESDPAKKDILWKNYEDTELKPFLVRYEKLLSENRSGFFVGNQLTWADLWIFHDIQSLCMHLLNGHTKLENFINRIENLPNIKLWLAKRPKTQW